MPEKRRTRTTDGQVKNKRSTTQTTLRSLFQKTNFQAPPSGGEQELHPKDTDPAAPSLEAVDADPPARPSTNPPPKPSQRQPFPIFARAARAHSVREKPRDIIVNVDDTEIIDITDMSSDIDLPTEPPLSSTQQLSPRSELSRETSHLPPPSPIHLDAPCHNDTSLPHANAHGPTPPDKRSKDVLTKRTLGSGAVVPLPSSCSQHVRGVQHSYTCGRAPLERRVLQGSDSSGEGTLDFLTKRRQPDGLPSTPSDRIHRHLSPQQCEEYLESFSRDWTDAHPAFTQISVQRGNVPLHHGEMWTRRFRPRRANEVLGNERHALYLRDWLRALELHLEGRHPEESVPKCSTARENKERSASRKVERRGVKRPRVVRTVTKKRSNKKRRVDSDDGLDDFVVFSNGDEEPVGGPPEDSEDEFAFCQRTLNRLRRRDTIATQDAHSVASDGPDTEIKSQSQEPVQTSFTDNLTNTLLIAGPSGCGKTAAVYACAEELGWKVFEVYPGIGRRNGASLEHLVGDVGRNHIVQTVHRRAPTKTKAEVKEHMGLRGYLGKKKTGEFAGFGESQEAGTEGQPIKVEGNSLRHELSADSEDASEEVANSGKCHAESDGSRPIVRQSLVLLEEVDILFREDAGFWPAVVDFIRCCQRPVVLTCNDPGLVPLGDLPLQTVLVFEPCPSTVAATFLQCVSLAEGSLVPHEDLMVLYESTHAIDGLDGPGYRRAERAPLPDLRRSITQLQMLCAGARHGSTSEMHQGDEADGRARRSARPISAASRVAPIGSRVGNEWWRQMNRHSELMSHVDAGLCGAPMGTGEVVLGEEEVGYVVLEEREGLGDELIAEEAIRHSRGVHEECGTGPNEASINPAARLDATGFRARVEHRSRMVGALQDVVGPAVALMPQRSVFLDYIPWVRHMVLVDDDLERRALDVRGSGRCTRNSLRTVHARNVVMREGEREVLRTSRLVFI